MNGHTSLWGSVHRIKSYKTLYHSQAFTLTVKGLMTVCDIDLIVIITHSRFSIDETNKQSLQTCFENTENSVLNTLILVHDG